ncbi:YpiB family protein [Bacillus alkalicellulosilyticus]|uniref:YpiB family protein n=1 Tax=Alkalihalobacterium alkalicellulosilyticum TaxID=1912214 RepID=UPI000997A87B|nr:YpiB family protein [Bacillus alkalicellulosilyticus]
MKKWVSAVEKRNFIKWFLDNHRLKRNEARMLLEFILKNHHILENIRFTEQIKPNEKTIVISSLNSDEPGFEFYYNKRKTDDVSTALGELMANPSAKVNMIVYFYGKSMNHRYLQLIEIPALDNIKRHEKHQKYSKEVDLVIEKAMLEKERQTLRHRIDLALDELNESLFKKLVVELKELEKKIESIAE